MKKIRFLIFIIGIGLTLFGLFSAIKQNNVYWYSYFVIGVFFICDYIDYQFRKKSVLSLIFDKKFKKFFLIYFLFVLFTIVIEVLGRVIGKMWYYPNYDLLDHIIHVFLIAYPFGALSVVAVYNVFKDLSKRVFKHKPNYEFSERFMQKVSTPLIVFSVAIYIFLAIYHIYIGPANTKILSLVFLSVLGLDAVNFKINKKSIFSEIIAGNYSIIFSVILTTIVSGLIHEVPNTFSYEWIYQNIPFTSYEIWDVSVFILTAGWLFLTTGSVVLYNLVVGDRETLMDKFRQKIREI